MILQLYIGDGNLKPNTTYTVTISQLRDRRFTTAFINSVSAPVNYLVIINQNLDLRTLTGELFIGGYKDVNALKVFSSENIAQLNMKMLIPESLLGYLNYLQG